MPRRWRKHWLKLGGQAASSYRAAVELKCLDCCAWQRTEARRCEIRGCPLWAVSGRIFGCSGSREGPGLQDKAEPAPGEGDQPAEEGGHRVPFDEEAGR